MLYSEGINVGYRYYDAHHETPLFPFGYGLSYTSFRYSDLRVTPQQLRTTSALGPTRCECNGQACRQVTVSATITNTGKVPGSDVAQLYLSDPGVRHGATPAAEGLPQGPLRPGQSATVRFSLNGHDLSYWNSAANGWVVPAGQFGVYLGDSSALAGLPRRDGLTVPGDLERPK